MRTVLWLLLTAAAVPALAADVRPMPRETIYLQGERDLAQLAAANPDHYARAQRVMAAANELCRAKPPQVEFAASRARGVSCLPMLLKTSNPPKRQITFTLDTTRYIALVTVTASPPRLSPAR